MYPLLSGISAGQVLFRLNTTASLFQLAALKKRSAGFTIFKKTTRVMHLTIWLLTVMQTDKEPVTVSKLKNGD